MTYVKIEDDIFRHPKMIEVSSGAKLLYIASICYCAQEKRGDSFPFSRTPDIAGLAGVDHSLRLAMELCKAGLWEKDGGTFRIVAGVRLWQAPTNRPPKSIWRELRDTVFRRDDYTCRYCGARGGRLEADHVVPVSRGGNHTIANLVTACLSCNRRKSDKTAEEWAK